MPVAHSAASWVTWLLALYLFWGALSGLRRGLILVAASLLGYLVGFALATRYQYALTHWVASHLPLSRWVQSAWPPGLPLSSQTTATAVTFAQALLGVLVFIAVIALTERVARAVGAIVTRVVGVVPFTGTLNALGGVAAGVLEHGVVAAVVMTVVLGFAPLAHTPVAAALQHSPLAMALTGWTQRLEAVTGGHIP